ncbi:MAG: M14 family zinc carboxypeptidase [candidate division WOR-3 bacterium]
MKLSRVFLILAGVMVFFGISPAQSRDLVRITNATRDDVRNIENSGAWVNYVNRTGVVAEATVNQQRALADKGYRIEIITPDITGVYERNFQESDGRYLTYAEYCDTMAVIATNNPAICRLETLGLSYRDNLLLMMKISDNPQIDEPEPAVHFEGDIHGDEKIGWAITFELLKYLVRNYGTDTVVTRLVDSREIYLLPMYNPDGYISSSRYNGNSVDLNRNWGWMWGDEISQGASPFSEPENRAVLAHLWRNPAVTFVSYHAGTTFISHPWSYCYSYQNTIPELNLIQFLSARYDHWTHYTYGQGADSMYLINGSTKDFDYGYGMMGWSIEVHPQKTPPASEIDPCFNLNLPAILEFIHLAGKGIHGTVTDAFTGTPVPCQIWVQPANWLSYNSPTVGDFHRFYLPGTYTLTFRSPGYRDTTIESVVVPSTGDSAVWLEVQLAPDSTAPLFAFRHIYNSFVTPSANRTYPVRTLGPRDSTAFLLDNGKTICLDMVKPVYNREGSELVIYRSAGTGSAQVQGAQSWHGPWVTLGTATTPETYLDIGSAGLDSVRFLRLTATGAFYLDAVEGVNTTGIADQPQTEQPPRLRIVPNPARTTVVVYLNPPTRQPVTLKLTDPAGRTVQTFTIAGQNWTLSLKGPDGRRLKPGVYFLRPNRQTPVRLVISE